MRKTENSRPRRDRRHRALRLGVFGLASFAVLVVIVTGLGAWLYAYAVLHPGCQGDRASLDAAGFVSEPVAFESEDGTIRRGWYSEGPIYPDVVVIVVPGHGGNTAFALGDAVIFANAGYGTLIYEHRSCADPHLSASTGIYESQDVVGAVQFLELQRGIHKIAAFGFSEGGTAAILAAVREPEIDVVIAVGGYASLADDTLDPPPNSQSPPERVFRRMALWSLDIQLNLASKSPSPITVIHEIGPRPIFLIYGDGERIAGDALYQAAGEPKTLWIVPGATHGSYASAAPEEYAQHLRDFLADSIR